MKKLWKIFVTGVILLFFQQISYAQEWQYEVKKGDSLWTIADQYLIHDSLVRQLQKYNDIANPLILQPGQIIKIPVEWLGNLPSSAKVQAVRGEVEVTSNNQTSKIQVGHEIKANDQIVTGEDGSIQIEFSDKSLLQVYSNSSLVFQTMKQSHDGSVINVKIDIEQGRVNVHAIPNKSPGHRMQIESPSAVTAVRGTEFRVGVDTDSHDTVTEVLKGNVVVSAVSRDIVVKNLYGTKTVKGSKPIKPVKLLQGPEIQPQSTVHSKVMNLSWKKLDKAKNYRVRVSSNDDFSDVFYDKVVAETQAKDIFFADDGQFYASVRASDENGIEGLDSIAKLEVNARPEPPLTISPKDNSSTFDALPEFAWATPLNGIEKLRFQLSSNPDFNEIVVDQAFAPTETYTLDDSLAAGQYYWRVANIDSDGQGPFSKAMSLTIRSKPDLNSEIVKSESGSQVSLNMTKDPSVSRYHVQVARDAKFTNIIFDDWISGEQITFNAEGAGSYFIRLGVEDQATDTINYSDAQKVIVPFDQWGKVLLSFITGLLIAL